MQNKLSKTRFMLAALLLTVTFVSVLAQDYDEIKLTPQLQAALAKYDSHSVRVANGLIRVEVINKYGFINTEGEEVVPCIYDEAYNFKDGFALVMANRKFGFVNTDGDEVVPCKYDYINIRDLFSYGYADVRLNGQYGIVNTTGKEIVPCAYDLINWIDGVLFKVKLNEKYGLFNSSGKELAPCIYEVIECRSADGPFLVRAKGKYGTIDADGNYTFSRDVTINDFRWIVGNWCRWNDDSKPELTINWNGEVSFTDEDPSLEKKIANIYYDNASDKYFLVCPRTAGKDYRYQIDFKRCSLIAMNGTRIGEDAELVKHEVVKVVEEPKAEAVKERELIPEPKTTNDEVFNSAAIIPSFPGGNGALMNYLSTHIKYPQSAQDNNIQGKVVVQFVVEKDGSIGEIKVVRGVDKDLDREAVRVCKSLPKFSPARNANNEPVRMWYTCPVTFKLQSDN
ncbi:MAG: TonB family protein [Muribaculaceae bacterium]|nr:TonB family protein [Muribaculaceae bacterium]